MKEFSPGERYSEWEFLWRQLVYVKRRIGDVVIIVHISAYRVKVHSIYVPAERSVIPAVKKYKLALLLLKSNSFKV
jgi:hypothetical protein